MAATSKSGFGHEDRSSDGGEVLDSETSASEGEEAAAAAVGDSLVEDNFDKSLGHPAAAAVRDLLASLARTPIREDLCTGRNMVAVGLCSLLVK